MICFWLGGLLCCEKFQIRGSIYGFYCISNSKFLGKNILRDPDLLAPSLTLFIYELKYLRESFIGQELSENIWSERLWGVKRTKLGDESAEKLLWTWRQIKFIHPLITFCIRTKKNERKNSFVSPRWQCTFDCTPFFCLQSSFLCTKKLWVIWA